MNTIVDAIHEAKALAFKEGIEANAVVINDKFKKVPPFCWGVGGINEYITQPMICGMEAHFSPDMPEGYGFAVFERVKPTVEEKEVILCAKCKCFMEFRDSVKEEEGADGTCYRLVMHCFDHDFALVNATDYCSWGVKRNEND